MDIVLATVNNLIIGFAIMLWAFVAYIVLGFVMLIIKERRDAKQTRLRRARAHEALNIAETPRAGAWQYPNDFFDKITEFRNDFA